MKLAIVVLAACAPAPAEPVHNHVGTPVAEPSSALEVSLERAECVGDCPVYKVTIHANGAVDWDGIAHVNVIGKSHGNTNRGALDELAVAIDAARFFERDKWGYLTEPKEIVVCTDLPTVTISVTRGRRSHTIVDTLCHSDPDLAPFERLIDTVAKSATWIGP